MTAEPGDEAVVEATLAIDYYERCLVELQKWKDSNVRLGGLDNDPDHWAAFLSSMQNTVKALDNVVSAASAAKHAEGRAIRSNYEFRVSNNRLRESRQLWNERIRQYKAARISVARIMPN